ncbi:MAG: flagella basal body P-ring formation protein FlgA [Oricola sp.]|nr:MAG: flagella basal body P-ring formation protein FlgA [Oricola sp.]
MRPAGLIAALAFFLQAVALPGAAADASFDYAVVERIVYPGQTIGMDNVAVRQHTRAIPDDYPVVRTRAQLAGMVATRTLLPGRAIAPDMLRAPFAIEQGELISVSLQEGPLSIVMKAIALQDGTIGETIRVRNAHNGRSVCAIVRSPSLAEVC